MSKLLLKNFICVVKVRFSNLNCKCRTVLIETITDRGIKKLCAVLVISMRSLCSCKNIDLPIIRHEDALPFVFVLLEQNGV